MRRRTYVATLGALSGGIVGGCLGGDETAQTSTTGGDATATDEEETETATEERRDAGKQLWRRSMRADQPRGRTYHVEPMAETAYVTAGDGLAALDLATGEQRWRRDGGTYRTLTADNQGIFAVRTDGTLVAYDPATGEQRWASEWGVEDWGVTLATTDTHVAVRTISDVGIYERENGTEIYRNRDDTVYSIVTYDGLFVVTGSSTLTAYEPDGTVAWRSTPARLGGDAAVADGIYVGSIGDVTGGFDLDSREVAWERDLGLRSSAFVTATDGTAVVRDIRSGGVYVVDPDSGEQQWSVDYSGASDFAPVILDSAVALKGTEWFTVDLRDRADGSVIGTISGDQDTGVIEHGGSDRTLLVGSRDLVAYRV